MNILRIVYDWPDENNITEGLAPAPYELSLSQAKLGHKIYVLCGNLNGKNLKNGRFSYTLADGNITVYNLPRAITGFGPFLSTSIAVVFYYFYLRITKDIDIVHNHGHLGIWLLLYKWLFSFSDEAPIVGHYHIVAAAREKAIKAQGAKLNLLTRFFEYPLHKFSDSLLAKVSKHIVTVSQDNVLQLQQFYNLPAQKITLLESGVDLERFKKEGEKVATGFAAKDIIIGNGGRLGKRKNIDLLVQSLARLPENYKLILWGNWDKNFRPIVEDIIVKNRLMDRVKYLGPASYFKIDKYYRAIDVFVLPSSYEGVPKVVVEALACGCKTLASGFKMQHSIKDLTFIKDLSFKNLSAEIIALSKSQANYDQARQILTKHYSWDSKANILNKIYDQITA